MARSLDAAMEEERREVLSLLESTAGAKARLSPTNARTSSPYTTARSPIRSMLDVDPTPRHSSIAGSNVGTTQGPVRSMLDINGPPSAPLTRNTQTSPIEKHLTASSAKGSTSRIRSLSDATPRQAEFGPRSAVVRPDPTADYQFAGILPSNPGGPRIRKRNTLAGRKSSVGPNMTSAMAEVVRATDLGGYGSSRDRQSRSPHNRFGGRAHSPASSMLSSSSAGNFSSTKDSGAKLALDDGTMVDMNSAYRRLSDANLARSGGILSKLSRPTRGRASIDGKRGLNSARLEKDYTYQEGEEAIESSDEELITSDEEGLRGRRKGGKVSDHDREDSAPEAKTLGMGNVKGPRKTLSLMAAAEEERKNVERKYKVRSLLDPEIKITGPSGDRTRSRYIHPSTSFDDGGASGVSTPMSSDTEADIKDIKRAQKLTVNMTPIMSYPESHRCVRTIYRGDFAKIQQEAQEDQRRMRKYLVATDLSDEAAHAMEWTIGTVLRDGDTMLAIYCVDEESGMGIPTDSSANQSGSEETAMKEQAAFVAATAIKPPMANATSSGAGPSPLGLGEPKNLSLSPSPSGRAKSKAEQDRYHAVQDITERVSKLLRKTRLQVRVVIEVIHCKSPKHLITEVIDFINPTLVILGSRGRSALKGVILGSFSNYLVTKSSVPVMVARKKLRKHNKFKQPSTRRLTNNLTNISGSALAAAKID